MNWAERAKELLDDPTMAYELGMEAGLALVNERLDAEGLRGKVWQVMPYRCKGCGSTVYVECEVGVEGPNDWRADSTFVASPFSIGRCSRCPGERLHVFKDIEFPEPVEAGTKFEGLSGLGHFADFTFRVPREPVRYPSQGCDDDGNVIYGTAAHAFMATPMHAINRQLAARRG